MFRHFLLPAALSLASALGSAAGASYGPFRAIDVSGNAAVTDADIRAVTAAYEGRALTIEDLETLADSFIEPCDRAALALCRADIPVSGLATGTLEVRISEGYVDEIAAEPDIAPIIRKVLAPILAERPLTKHTLDRAVANLSEVQGLTVTAVRPERLAGDAYRLAVQGEYRRGGLRGLVTNRGSRKANPWRSVVVSDRGSVLLAGDRAQAAYLTRPENPGELSYGVLRYTTAPTRQGTTTAVELNASQSSPRTILDGRDASGSLYRGILTIRQPVRRRTHQQVDAAVSFEGVRSAEEEDGVELYTDELRILRGSIFADLRTKPAALTAQVTLSGGLDALGAQGGSRADGQTDFLTLAGEVTATRRIGKRGFIKAAVTGQAATAPLFFQEEFSFGGGRFGRAHDYGEVRGDHGAAAYVEAGGVLRLPSREVTLGPYAFVDVGATWNEGAGLSADGKALWSTGAGVRTTLPFGFEIDYEAAVPLSDAPYTDDDEDVRHRVQVGWSSDR